MLEIIDFVIRARAPGKGIDGAVSDVGLASAATRDEDEVFLGVLDAVEPSVSGRIFFCDIEEKIGRFGIGSLWNEPTVSGGGVGTLVVGIVSGRLVDEPLMRMVKGEGIDMLLLGHLDGITRSTLNFLCAGLILCEVCKVRREVFLM